MISKKPLYILQLTDFHLFCDTQTKLLRLNPYDTLTTIFEKLIIEFQTKEPALILFTGDISQDYTTASYELIKELCSHPLPYQAAVIPGNHDVPEMLYSILGHFSKKLFTLDGWRIILLNTCWPMHVAGLLSNKELLFLEESLANDPNTPTLIFLHHQVLSVGSAWLDNLGLKNANDFLTIIDKYQNIKAVISGHVHQETLNRRNNVDFITTPSTSWQFACHSNIFKLDSLMPGYRWLELYDNGIYKTYVERITENQVFIPDLESEGY